MEFLIIYYIFITNEESANSHLDQGSSNAQYLCLIKNKIEQIRNEISLNHIKEAIKSLLKLTKKLEHSTFYDEAILISANNHELIQRERMEQIDFGEFTLRRSRIISQIFSLLKDIDEHM